MIDGQANGTVTVSDLTNKEDIELATVAAKRIANKAGQGRSWTGRKLSAGQLSTYAVFALRKFQILPLARWLAFSHS